MDFSALDILKRRNTVLRAVDGHICVAFRISYHRLQDAARRREEAGPALVIRNDPVLRMHILPVHPFRQFLKSQDCVYDIPVFLRLVFFGDTGADKHGPGIRNPAFDIRAVRQHRGQNVRQIRQQIRKILADQKVDGMAAGGNHDIPVPLFEHAVILSLDHRRAERGLFDVVKAQFLQRIPHRLYARAVKIGDKGRGQTGDDRLSALQEDTDLLRLIHNLLRILGTYHETLSAEDALIRYDVSLTGGKAD